MSKFIPFVADIHMEVANGEPLFRVPGTDGVTTIKNETPWKVRQLSFLLESVGDAAFTEGLDAIEGEILRAETRGELKKQSKAIAPAGGYKLDDDAARRLMNAVMKPSGKPAFPALAFNNVPFILAVKNMTTPVEEEKPVNGLSAVHSGQQQAFAAGSS